MIFGRSLEASRERWIRLLGGNLVATHYNTLMLVGVAQPARHVSNTTRLAIYRGTWSHSSRLSLLAAVIAK